MRRGPFQWRVKVPADGRLIHGGLVPLLIQWDSRAHPAASMADSGCSLEALEAFTPHPMLLREQLTALGLGDAIAICACSSTDAPRLVARIHTPAGTRMLSV
jgi:hypothetical protein